MTVISVVAVLVANVSFLGYVTPPGGSHPYWENCYYETYVIFLVFNGLAFLFSLGAMGVVVVVPWLFANLQIRERVGKWTGCGLILLGLSIATFTGAFLLAGLVTGGYQGPPPQCGVLPCSKGGMACSTSVQDGSRASLLSMNDIYGECFHVFNFTTGQEFSIMYAGRSISKYNNTGTFKDQPPDASGCFMLASPVGISDVKKFSSTTKNVLCYVGVPPGKDSAERGKETALFDSLRVLSKGFQAWKIADSEPEIWGLQMSILDGSCQSTQPGCLCSHHMLAHRDNLTFVSYAEKNSSLPPRIYIANSAAKKDSNVTGLNLNNFNTSDVWTTFGQNMTLYSPLVYYKYYIAVYDELKIRCSDSYDYDHPTLCLFDSTARGGHNKWYRLSKKRPLQLERQCCPERQASEYACDGLAVDQKGNYILMSKLGEFGAEVQYDEHWVGNLGWQMGNLVFIILGFAILLYSVISVYVYRARPRCLNNRAEA